MKELTLYKELRMAIKVGNLEKVKAIISADPDVVHGETIFGTCVHFASKHGQLEILQYLVSVGANMNADGGETPGGRDAGAGETPGPSARRRGGETPGPGRDAGAIQNRRDAGAETPGRPRRRGHPEWLDRTAVRSSL